MSNLFQSLSAATQILYDIALAIQALSITAKMAHKRVE
jgi:hypothetical protein